ncbi:MAG: hypothetical protein SGILL_005821, partial [Bacillariaceae sp.]
GVVGLKESYDTRRALGNNIRTLVAMTKQSKSTVILTGAGISTASKIPDFRGPSGIWTLEKERKKRQQQADGKQNGGTKRKRQEAKGAATTATETADSVPSNSAASTTQQQQKQQPPAVAATTAATIDFANAQPTLTHRAITALVEKGTVDYVVTQNVDGLHRKSGLSRDHHSTVHGCVFTEKCSQCGMEVFGDNEVDGLSFEPTGNACGKCHTKTMHDILLDWEDMVLDLELCETKCKNADLCICLGTSLRINPVGSLPLLSKKFVIVNLQPTPLDDQASLVIRARVDEVMARLMEEMGYTNWDTGTGTDGTSTLSSIIEREWTPPNGDNSQFAAILADKKRQKEGE